MGTQFILIFFIISNFQELLINETWEGEERIINCAFSSP